MPETKAVSRAPFDISTPTSPRVSTNAAPHQINIDSSNSDSTLSADIWYVYDELLDSCNVGRYHIYLLLLCGWANASDAIEIMSASFILPNATIDLSLTDTRKGILGGIIFAGMMLGGYIWGTLADKQGRLKCLIGALLLNSFGGILASISSSYWILVLCRLVSGLGVGGSVPVLFTYFCEFLPTNKRGQYMVYLAWFWMIGASITVILAWCIIPIPIEWILPGNLIIHSWRLFTACCAIPSFICAMLLLTCPESPRFLLLQGNSAEAIHVLKTIYQVNQRQISMCCHRIDPNDDVTDEQLLDDDDIDTPIDPQQSPFSESMYSMDEESRNKSYQKNNNTVTYDMYITNDFHTNLKKLHLLLNTTQNELIMNAAKSNNRNATALTNLRTAIKRTMNLFDSTQRTNSIKLAVVWYFMSFGYYGLTMWIPSYFAAISTDSNSMNEYLSALCNALANLPGNIISVYTVSSYGRRPTLVLSLLLSSVVSLFIPLAGDSISALILVCVLGTVNVGAWNSINIITTETYSTHNRSTAYGLMAALGRIGAVTGNLVFANFIRVSAGIPLFITAAMFMIASIAACLLPETMNKMIQ